MVGQLLPSVALATECRFRRWDGRGCCGSGTPAVAEDAAATTAPAASTARNRCCSAALSH
ncbi:MAG: hypothetical protein ACLU0O_00615 [Collinsella sp.]